MRVPQPRFGSLPDHQLQREVGLTSEFELQRALNQPRAYEVGHRERRAINRELGWRQQERIAAARAHEDSLRASGFENGFSVDITSGVPDPIANPLPDPVVNHVDHVVDGTFRPEPIGEPFPDSVVTPETSPLDTTPYVEPSATGAPVESVFRSGDGIEVRFDVSFDDGFDDGFESEFESEFDAD